MQSAGLVVAVGITMVGNGVVCTTTTFWVGLMMKVGSMSWDCAVGGMKGVAVRRGEQAEAEIRVHRMMSNRRLGMRRSIS